MSKCAGCTNAASRRNAAPSVGCTQRPPKGHSTEKGEKGGVVEEGPGKYGRSQLTEVDGDGGSGACAVAEGREGAPRSVVSLPTQPGHEGTRDAHLPNA